jgi:hypothetical protein
MAQHTSPLTSAKHQLLRLEVESAGFDPEILRDFFWLINAHDRLIAFPLVCKNVIEIITCAKLEWNLSVSAFQLHENIIPLLGWIFENADNLAKRLGAEFNLRPEEGNDNPMMGRGVTRHPVYAAICNSSQSEKLKIKFRLIQAHLLFAHTNELKSKNDRDGYENYGEQPQWNGLPNSPSLASLAVRKLSENLDGLYADTLKSLAVEQDPDKFAHSLSNLPAIENADFLGHLQGFRNFIQKSSGIRDWVNRNGAGGGIGGGGNRIPGYLDFSERLTPRKIFIGDSDDEDYDWGNATSYTSISPSQVEQKILLGSDLSPDEFDNYDLYLFGGDKDHSMGGVSAISAAQLRHIVMLNQLLPFNFQRLTITEVANLLTRCAKWVIDTFGINIPSPKRHEEKDIRQLEAICMARVMLFSGSSIERAHNLVLLSSEAVGEDSPIAYIKDPHGKHQWRIKAIRPQYKTNQEVLDGTDRRKTDYFTLPDVAFTNLYIDLLVKANAREDNQADRDANTKIRVFRSRIENIRSTLTRLLKEMDPSGRLTISKLSKFLFYRVLEESNGDVCMASLISGDEHQLAHVRLFYTMLPVESIQRIYFDATREIVSRILSASNSTYKVSQDNPVQTRERFVGSRLCPKFDAVQKAIIRLKADIQIATINSDLIESHNLSSLIVIWHFAFASACRAIETPYMSLEEIDPVTGIGLLADKDDGTKYKARLVWIPPSILSQMERYQEYLLKLMPIPGMSTNAFPPVFFLHRDNKGRLKTQIVRPNTMSPLMDKYLPYPANFHRRFMRTELLIRGCAMEAVDAYMGHWNMGEEPWATYSSFSYQQYRDEMNKYLVPLLDEIGLNGQINYGVPFSANNGRPI